MLENISGPAQDTVIGATNVHPGQHSPARLQPSALPASPLAHLRFVPQDIARRLGHDILNRHKPVWSVCLVWLVFLRTQLSSIRLCTSSTSTVCCSRHQNNGHHAYTLLLNAATPGRFHPDSVCDPVAAVRLRSLPDCGIGVHIFHPYVMAIHHDGWRRSFDSVISDHCVVCTCRLPPQHPSPILLRCPSRSGGFFQLIRILTAHAPPCSAPQCPILPGCGKQ